MNEKISAASYLISEEKKFCLDFKWDSSQQKLELERA